MGNPRKALLLDLDGTLVATDQLHYQATIGVLTEYGIAMDHVRYRADIHGGANQDIMGLLFGDRAALDGPEYVRRKEAAFRVLLDGVPTVPGALALIERARDADLKIAVVTNAPRENMELLLVPFGGEAAFDAVILGDELAHGKPHPLPYLTALERLGVEPGNACGFEDSASGVRALVAASVFAVGVGAGDNAATLLAAGAGSTVADLEWEGLASIGAVAALFSGGLRGEKR